jgi:hypothetical protein
VLAPMPRTQPRRTVAAHIERGANMDQTHNAGTRCVTGAVILAISEVVTDTLLALAVLKLRRSGVAGYASSAATASAPGSIQVRPA